MWSIDWCLLGGFLFVCLMFVTRSSYLTRSCCLLSVAPKIQDLESLGPE